jgi:hypothetical protein
METVKINGAPAICRKSPLKVGDEIGIVRAWQKNQPRNQPSLSIG